MTNLIANENKSPMLGDTKESIIEKTYFSPFTLSLWFDKLTMILRQAQDDRSW